MSWNHRAISDWLLGEGPGYPDLTSLCHALGVQLQAAGAPVCRLRLAIRTVHPLLTAVSATWERDAKPQRILVSTHGLEQRSVY